MKWLHMKLQVTMLVYGTNSWDMREKELKVLMDSKLFSSLKFLNFNFYKNCVFGKHDRQKFKSQMHVRKGIPDYTHYDVLGPSRIVYYGGFSYFVKFIDDYSRKVWIYLLKRKAYV